MRTDFNTAKTSELCTSCNIRTVIGMQRVANKKIVTGVKKIIKDYSFGEVKGYLVEGAYSFYDKVSGKTDKSENE